LPAPNRAHAPRFRCRRSRLLRAGAAFHVKLDL
jgi:hypothetical protein